MAEAQAAESESKFGLKNIVIGWIGESWWDDMENRIEEFVDKVVPEIALKHQKKIADHLLNVPADIWKKVDNTLSRGMNRAFTILPASLKKKIRNLVKLQRTSIDAEMFKLNKKEDEKGSNETPYTNIILIFWAMLWILLCGWGCYYWWKLTQQQGTDTEGLQLLLEASKELGRNSSWSSHDDFDKTG